LRVNICNLCPSLELTSPVYFSNATAYCASPSQQTRSNIIFVSFRIAPDQKDVKGVLLYKLRRKYTTRTDNHLNNSTKSIENTATNLYLLAVWDIEDDKHTFYVCLLECPADFTWDEDKLWALYSQYNDQFCKDYKDYMRATWSMHGDKVMKTERDIIYGSDYELNIVLSEETRSCFTKEPVKIDPKRLVLSLSMLIVLIYAARLYIPPSVRLNIHNQCLNVNLVSPTYVTSNGLKCHRTPDYKVCAGDTTRSGFIIGWHYQSYGILIYKLQRRKSHESTEINKDTSSTVHLLVVWKIFESKKLYAETLLVEHDKGFTWNEDRLNKLYHGNHARVKKHDDTASYIWSMNNHIALKTTFSVKDLKGSYELNISISEEKDGYAIRPFRINPER
jgi:hypothetical protein